ncbi:type II toxin-antitoxin system PemK/MazF family toxin [Patescibacteria group bacterium]|nr:type II toxin-antitoxin system PemK/MazF family toxin [Patescibacteria group bacterium]
MKNNKDFDKWNNLKKNIDITKDFLKSFPKEGEVWISFLGKNIGVEQNGGNKNFSRPVLVVKRFNNQMFWVVPLSTKQKKLDFYYNFKDKDEQNISVILAQLKLMSIKRFKRDVFKINKKDFIEIKYRLKNFFN